MTDKKLNWRELRKSEWPNVLVLIDPNWLRHGLTPEWVLNHYETLGGVDTVPNAVEEHLHCQTVATGKNRVRTWVNRALNAT
jgi:hypothetical protein